MIDKKNFTDRPSLLELEERQQHERQKRVALYEAFKTSPLHPVCTRIYYPGCGRDDAAVTAFPESEIHLVDIDKKAVEELRKRHLSSNIHIVEKSIADYDPGSVDVLILHGTNFGVEIDKVIDAVKEGGFVLSGDDCATKMRSDLAHRSDLEFVGILHPNVKAPTGLITGVQDGTRREVVGVSPEFFFEPGSLKHVELVETDVELERADPSLYRYMQRQIEPLEPNFKDQTDSKSVLAFTRRISSIPIPPKQPGAELCIYRKVKLGTKKS